MFYNFVTKNNNKLIVTSIFITSSIESRSNDFDIRFFELYNTLKVSQDFERL